MLDILSSPLKGYLAQTLQFYLSKYLKDIHLEGFGFFGNDLVLNDLEIKRHVLQSALDLPPTFDFSRGFIRELRIHIPWTQILSQPIEVKLYTVELILTAKDESTPRQRRNSMASEGSYATMTTHMSKSAEPETPIDAPKSSWLQATLAKILANVSIQINNLVLKYEEDDMVLSVTLGLLDLYSAGNTSTWPRGFAEPKGDQKAIAKCIDAKDISVFLDRYTSDRVAVDVDSDLIHRQVIGYEVPVLRRTSLSLRCMYALEPSANRVGPTKSVYTPHVHGDPFLGASFEGNDVVVLDVYVKELCVSLSDRQVHMLIAFVTPKPPTSPHRLVRASSSPLLSSASEPSEPLVPLVLNPPPPAPAQEAPASSWTSWVYGAIIGDDDGAVDELEKELLTSLEKKIPEHEPSLPECSITIAEDPPVSIVTVRVSIQSASLTLRSHGEDATASSPTKGASAEAAAVEFVPVANVGLVPIDLSQHTKTKVSKAANVIGVVEASCVLLRVSTDGARQDSLLEVREVLWHQPTTLVAPTLLRAGDSRVLYGVPHPNASESYFGDLLAGDSWQHDGASPPVACTCDAVSLSVIDDYWTSSLRRLQDCVDNQGNAHVSRMVDHVVEMVHRDLDVCVPAPRFRRQVHLLAQAFVQRYELDRPVLENLEQFFLPAMRTWTAISVGHKCVHLGHACGRALRLRHVASPELVSIDVALGPMHLDLRLESLTAHMAFLNDLDFSRLDTAHAPEKAATAATMAMTLVHATSLSLEVHFDDGHALSLQVHDVLLSMLGEQDMRVAVANTSVQVDENDVLNLSHAALDLRYTTDVMQASADAYFESCLLGVSTPLLETLLSNLLPTVCAIVRVEYAAPTVTNAMNCHDAFTIGMHGVELEASLVTGQDLAMATARASVSVEAVDCSRRGRVIFESSRAEVPWVATEASAEVSVTALRQWLPSLVDMLAIRSPEVLPPSIVHIGLRWEMQSFEAQWHRMLPLLAMVVDVPVALPSDAPAPAVVDVPLWTLALQVALAPATIHLSRHVLFTTPALRIATNTSGLKDARGATCGGRCRLEIDVSPWNVAALASPLLSCAATRVVVAIDVSARTAPLPAILLLFESTVMLGAVDVSLSPLQMVLLGRIPTLPPAGPTEPLTLAIADAPPVLWSVKTGLELARTTLALQSRGIDVACTLTDLFLAAQVGTVAPHKTPAAPSEVPYLDLQVQLHDVTCTETLTSARIPSTASIGAFDKVLSPEILAGILFCLDESDIRAFGAATRYVFAPATASALAFWRETTLLVKACCEKVQFQSLVRAQCPIISTHTSPDPWLSLFARNYNANTGELGDWCLLGSVEDLDVLLSEPTLTVGMQLVKNLASRDAAASPSASSSDTALPYVSVHVGSMRLLLPVASSNEHAERQLAVCAESTTVETVPHLDLPTDGLSHPPFRVVSRRPRAPSSALQVAPKAKTMLRAGAVYMALVQYDATAAPARSPYEVAVATLSEAPLTLVRVDYLVPPWFLAIEVTPSKHIDVHVTKLGLELDEPALHVVVDSVGRLMRVTDGSPRPPEHKGDASSTETPLSCAISIDGVDARVQSGTDTLLLRVGPVAFRHTLHDGRFSVKNVVVGHRVVTDDEALVIGPHSDPHDWQLAVEKYSEKLFHASWSLSEYRTLSGLVEVQGLQCHVSPALVAMAQRLALVVAPLGASSIPSPTSIWTPLGPFLPRFSLPGVGPVDHAALKLLWSPSQLSIAAASACVVCNTGALFASLDARVTATDQALVAAWPATPLFEWCPVKLLDFVVTWQRLGVLVLDDACPVTVALGPQLGRSKAWHRLQAQVAEAPALLRDVDLRCTGDVKQLLRLINRQLVETRVYPTEVHLDGNAVHVSVSMASLRLLQRWSAAWSVPATDTSFAKASDDVVSVQAPTVHDFAELTLRLDPRAHHARPGELVCTETVTTNATFSGSVLSPTALLDVASAPPQDDDEDEDELRLIDILNDLARPWDDDDNKDCLELRWRYPSPRQLTRVTAMPLRASVAPRDWPRIEGRLCDVRCEVRCFDSVTSSFVSIGIVHVPWGAEDGLPRTGSAPSLAAAIAQWMSEDDDVAPQVSEAYQLSFDARDYPLVTTPAATQWELRWRLPRVDASSLPLYVALSAQLRDAVRVSSVAAISSLPLLHVVGNLHEVKLAWHDGGDDVHELLHVKATDVSVHLRTFAGSARYSCVVAGVLGSEMHNLTTLATTTLLQPWQVTVVLEQAAQLSLALTTGALTLQLTQYALLFMMQLSQSLTEPSPPTKRIKYRICIHNQIDAVLLFRQVGSTEVQELRGLVSVDYSWHAITAPFELQFTRSLSHGWSTPCPIRAPGGVWHRPLPTGGIWVEVVVCGLETTVVVRGDVVVINHLDQRLQYRLNNEVAVTLGSSPQSHILERQSTRVSLRCDNGRPWSVAQLVASTSTPFAPVAATTTPEAPATLVVLSRDAGTMYVWVAIKRAACHVVKEAASVHRVLRWAWLEVHLWPVLTLTNQLAVPAAVSLLHQATGRRTLVRLAVAEETQVLEYNPQEPQILEVGGTSLAIPACASPEGDELAAYPVGGVLRVDAPKCGTIHLTRLATSPARHLALRPTLVLRNELPWAIVIDGPDCRQTVLPSAELSLAISSFSMGLQYIPETLLWTNYASQPSHVMWSLPSAPGCCLSAVVRHSIVDGMARVTLACHYQVRNQSRYPLQLLPTTLLAAKTNALVPTVAAPAASVWPVGTHLERPSSLHSSLKWIRTRLSRGSSIADDGLETVLTPALDATRLHCALSVAIAAPGYAWSRRSIELRPCGAQRLLLLHSDATRSDVMLTFAVVAVDDAVVLTIYEDAYPPVTLQNHLSRAVAVALVHVDECATIGANDTIAYDWQLQDSAYGSLPAPSVFDSPSPSPHARFRVRVAGDDCSWSSAVWLVEGIQFARAGDLVLLLTMYERYSVWMVHIECIDGGKSAPRVPCRPLAAPATRVSVRVDAVVVRCFDDHVVVHDDGPSYAEVLRLDAQQIAFMALSLGDVVPDGHKQRAALGYLSHIQRFTTSLLVFEALELVHFFPECNFPRALMCGNVSRSNAVVSDAQLLAVSIEPLVKSHALTLRLVYADGWVPTHSYTDALELAVSPIVLQVEDLLLVRLQGWLAPLLEAASAVEVTPTEPPLETQIALAMRAKRYIGRLVLSPVSLTITARFLYGLDRTPLSLSGVDLAHILCFDDQLAKDLAANYVADAVVRTPMVLMSLNVLGNPAGFVRDVSSGVQDLVRLPLLAVATEGYSPVSITKGLFRGAVSFATHTSVATLSSVSGVAHAISRSMDHISTSASTATATTTPPVNFTSGLAHGFHSFGQAIVGAATGVVTTPLSVLRDNQEQGRSTGLGAGVVGVGKGLVGIVAQPMSGMASLVSKTTDGLLVEMGVGGRNDAVASTMLPLRRHEALFVRWKLVGSVTGPIVFAHALYLAEQPSHELADMSTEWLLPSDAGVPCVLVVSPTHVYVVDACTDDKLEVIAVSTIAVLEQSLVEPTKLDVGVGGSAMHMRWYRFRLAMHDRRDLGRAIATFRKW
ncbi:hypothetical protein SDRG_14297 [Saprolegnia diclina VS20]|uniref:Chorein N-terminal domain-containing protein n=1 Tax=Saprolegnia diclina (strain VS20) TaxID=1156394 RepID=T0Q0J0_SAPDV|nr:hypothetical protein SDRG_14297 [Saprolegnia diclina VS20]EQC28026.1 hypothetical protein SDRG_14297 [Saprolegnia diclina VS20]|eukprot:XP_008618639.1 hypothetical protein SDRG_14297 [Saprolegnia diclina VS20]